MAPITRIFSGALLRPAQAMTARHAAPVAFVLQTRAQTGRPTTGGPMNPREDLGGPVGQERIPERPSGPKDMKKHW